MKKKQQQALLSLQQSPYQLEAIVRISLNLYSVIGRTTTAIIREQVLNDSRDPKSNTT
jgi:hypothetical protein